MNTHNSTGLTTAKDWQRLEMAWHGFVRQARLRTLVWTGAAILLLVVAAGCLWIIQQVVIRSDDPSVRNDPSHIESEAELRKVAAERSAAEARFVGSVYGSAILAEQASRASDEANLLINPQNRLDRAVREAASGAISASPTGGIAGQIGREITEADNALAVARRRSERCAQNAAGAAREADAAKVVLADASDRLFRLERDLQVPSRGPGPGVSPLPWLGILLGLKLILGFVIWQASRSAADLRRLWREKRRLIIARATKLRIPVADVKAFIEGDAPVPAKRRGAMRPRRPGASQAVIDAFNRLLRSLGRNPNDSGGPSDG
jgi:hypothetical protein